MFRLLRKWWYSLVATERIARMENGSVRENYDTVQKIVSKGPDMIPTLAMGARSREFAVRIECIRGLAHLAYPESRDALKSFETDPHPEIREEVEKALARVEEKIAAKEAKTAEV